MWKFNTQLLNSEFFCTAVNDFWPVWRNNKPCFTDPRIWWDAGKLQLKESAVSHSVASARDRQCDRSNLECEFRNNLSRGNSNTTSDRTRLSEIKGLLKAIDDQIVEGSIIDSKEKWTELGEKPTRYFYQLETQRQTCNSITELHVKNLTVTSDQTILANVENFITIFTQLNMSISLAKNGFLTS